MAVRLTPWALWQASVVALALSAAVTPPRWADPSLNPCAALPGGWQLLQWPGDGRCYRIFTVGAPGPCPPTQELAPHARTGAATCRCPPGSAQQRRRREDPDGTCYELYGRGPCDTGHYFSPVPPPRADDPDHRRLGQCLPLERCATEGHVFWPATGRCYPALSRGPCPKGELLVGPDGEGDGEGLPRCACARHGPLAAHFWAGGGDGAEADGGGACFEHYTQGPCLESGQLFLPDGRCGCHEGLPHFHAATGRCYPLGGLGPCASGQHFVSAPGEARARCQCRPGHVAWAPDAAAASAPAAPCHRLYTRGPCGEAHFLLDGATCAAQCPRGRLYFPERGACFRVGLRGPCAQGRVVVFEDAVSLRGRCGCPGGGSGGGGGGEAGGGRCGSTAPAAAAPCDARAGLVRWDAACHRLYTRGPCPEHQWLVPAREGRPGAGPGGVRRAARCECRPGFEPGPADGQCRPPAVAIADFLNRKYRPEADGAAGENDA